MQPEHDPASWFQLEAAIIHLIEPHVPRSQDLIEVTAQIQDGVPVACILGVTLECRPGTFDPEAMARLVPLLEKVHAVTVRYGTASFRLVGWKLTTSSIKKTARRRKKTT
jgi:hypothetical protein